MNRLVWILLGLAIGIAVSIVAGCKPASKPVSRPVEHKPTVIVTVPTPEPTPRPQTPQEQMQVRRWKTAALSPTHILKLDKAVALYERTQERYKAIEAMRPNGVPAQVVFTLHGRESTWNFARHLHEGSPLTHRTRYIPKGRPLKPDPPYTWEQSAEDALYKLKDLENRVDWSDLGNSLQAIEAYNGLGYQRYHPSVPSPYLWSGTRHYTRGKYVADGKFSATAVDAQLGCAAILIRMQERGLVLPFGE